MTIVKPIAVLLFAIAGGTAWWTGTFLAPQEAQAQEAPPPAPPAPSGSQEADGERENLKTLVENCRKCHEDVCKEWAETQHAKSWTDPVFQAQIEGLPDQGASCARCHAPQELLLTGYGKVPRGRKGDRDLGVNCVTCHMKGNSYFGPFDSTGHGGVDADPEFGKPGLCLSCHGQPEARKEHDQGTSFLAGPAAANGHTCQSCHMPRVERKLVTSPTIKEKYTIGVQPCRMHTFIGGRRGENVAGCAELHLRLDGGRAVAEITARTGHGLPATSGREVRLEVEFLDAGGASLGKDARSWRFPEGPVLPPDRAETVPFEAPPAAARARAKLVQVLLETPGRDASVVQPIAETEAHR